MTDAPLPGDIRQIDMANELLYDDVNKPDLGEPEDIGDFEPGDGFDDEHDALEGEEPDELPEVGEVDLDEEPILDELDDEEWNPEWDNAEHGEYTEEKETGIHDLTPEEIAEFDKEGGE